MRIGHHIRNIITPIPHVYLDYNATTPVSKRVQQKMNAVLKRDYGNPSSFYDLGRSSYTLIKRARQQVAHAIHAHYQDIIFTGSATEANNAVIASLSDQFFPLKKKIVSTPIEHSSIMSSLEFMKTKGVDIVYCPVDRKGRVILEEMEKLIDKDTFLICCMLANNEIGTLQKIASIMDIARRHDARVLSDCVQAFGKIPIDVESLGVDYATFSAHKIYGPKGIGALYIKPGNPFSPFIQGGHQEGGLRAGTESVHNIVGFGAACQDIDKHLSHVPQIYTLKEALALWLREVKEDSIINAPEECLPNTLNVTFPGVDNKELLSVLDARGISVSIGSACNSQQDNASHVLKAIGLTDDEAQHTIRMSLGVGFNKKHLKYVKNVFADYFAGRLPSINEIQPHQLTESLLFDDSYYILDVRPEQMLQKVSSLPNSHHLSIYVLKHHLRLLPKDKNILVVCLDGGVALAASYYLQAQGFHKITTLVGGITSWKEQHPELFRKYADHNTVSLESADM